MPRSLLRAVLISLVSLLTLARAPAAYAQGADLDESAPLQNVDAAMIRALGNARSALRTAAVGETTYVGYSPNFAGSNYWSIGSGNYRPGSSNANDFGYWDWDHLVHSDSLQGWWPNRRVHNFTGGLVLSDDQRPWWAIDIGNNANYVINQGPGLKRTTGVVGVWHRDPGGNGSDGVGWSPLSGSYSMWCGLRRETDFSQMDPITGNAFNALVLVNSDFFNGNGGGGPAVGTNQKWPGYGSQWDQMAYRDVDVSKATSITLRFKFRTNMSTGFGTAPATRTGWFDQDPYSLVAGNFISSSLAGVGAPIDSFMVYVGAGVHDSLGVTLPSADEYSMGSDGVTHLVFDRQRRYFSEVLRLDRVYREVFTTYGDNKVTTQTTSAVPVDAGWNGRARVVIRSKTNRGFDDMSGSVPGAYSSNGAGAVVVDDVEVDLGSGFVSLGDFESPAQVNDDPGVSPLSAWKTTGKPPGLLAHVHNIATLQYQDLCGPVGSPLRLCDLAGNVISFGDHDHNEAAGGPLGTVEEGRVDELLSPAIGLRNGGKTNEFGINATIAAATGGMFIEYDIYPGVFDPFTQGNLWEVGFQAWPARQSDGQLVWGSWGGIRNFFASDKECIHEIRGEDMVGRPLWSAADAEGGSVYPDSIRIRLEKRQECYRFGITLGCSPTDGAYFDNVSLAFVSAPNPGPDLSAAPLDLINDTFPVNGLNRNGVAPGTAAFDTTAALVKIGRNIAQNTNNPSRYIVPGDTATVASSQATRVDLVFRVSPGPGNLVTAGIRSSGLRLAPSALTAVNYLNGSNDRNFWAEYLRDCGEKGSPGGHPIGPTNGGRDWSALVWNSARCDTAEINLWPISGRLLGGPVPGRWSSMYHESDPKFTKLGLSKNRCWLKDPVAPISYDNTTCDIAQTVGNWPVTAGYVAENGLPLGQTYEYTKILPDGYFTPGTHVEYFFRADAGTGVTLGPDTSVVYPQAFDGSLDGKRWQEFSVLPDIWKKVAYGGLSQACVLFVDWADGRGSELGWVSVIDTLGGTQPSKLGAHNGWHAPGTGAAALNDPSNFVRNRNEQAGTTWDLMQVRGGADDPINAAGTLGADYANHSPSAVDGKWSFEGPSIGMLTAYYQTIILSTGNAKQAILGPFNNRSSDDTRMLREFLQNGTHSKLMGLWTTGSGFVEDTDQSGPDQSSFLHNYLKTSLRDPSYLALTGVQSPTIDLKTLSPVNSAGITYREPNTCTSASDVLYQGVGGVPSMLYSQSGGAALPVVAGVFHDVNFGSGEFWKSLVDGFDFSNLVSSTSYPVYPRLSYVSDIANVFAAGCSFFYPIICDCSDVPNSPDLAPTLDSMGLRNSPLRTGEAAVDFGLAKPDRVTVRVYDVSGRLVRTLVDRRFAAGRQSVVWDGLDSDGQMARRGVYFARVRYQQRGFDATRKLIVLR